MTPRDLILSLATMYGVEVEVAEILKDKPAPPFPDTLADLLVKSRKLRGTYLRHAAQASGLSMSQLDHYEKRPPANIGIRSIAKLAKGYRLPFAVVLFATMRDAGTTIPAPGAGVRKRRRKPLVNK